MSRNGHSGRCFRTRRRTAARLAIQGRDYQAELAERRADARAMVVKRVIMATQHLAAGRVKAKVMQRMLSGNQMHMRRAARGT